jgi:hypothetical protein
MHAIFYHLVIVMAPTKKHIQMNVVSNPQCCQEDRGYSWQLAVLVQDSFSVLPDDLG